MRNHQVPFPNPKGCGNLLRTFAPHHHELGEARPPQPSPRPSAALARARTDRWPCHGCRSKWCWPPGGCQGGEEVSWAWEHVLEFVDRLSGKHGVGIRFLAPKPFRKRVLGAQLEAWVPQTQMKRQRGNELRIEAPVLFLFGRVPSKSEENLH